jgi:ABC-type transporter Mla subunit MlaD
VRRRRVGSIAANPVLVGAVTVLVLVTAVFLAYNANSGLPFVPTFEVKVITPSGARLVPGNEVREGGERIGQVTETEVVRTAQGAQAELTLQLDQGAGPIPEDTRFLIRPRSTLGLKYVDLVRGSSQTTLPQGAALRISEDAIPPELDQFFSIFDEPTRENTQTNLTTFGSGFAGRGADLNQTLEALPGLLDGLVPVMQTLAADGTNLRGFVREIADVVRATRPVSGDLVAGLGAGADTFEALTRDGGASLRDTIAESPATLDAGIRSFPVQRPLLQGLAGLSDEITDVSAELRRSAPTISSALLAGTRTLPDLPPFNRRLGDTLQSARDIATAPSTNLVLQGFTASVDSLNPTLRWVGPAVTVCNYWNYWWTLLSDHINEQVPSGTLQRIQVKNAGGGLNLFGASQPVNGDYDATGDPVLGDPPALHAQPYGRAVDEQGNADCEAGQRGYPKRETVAPEGLNIATNARTPGNQGTTFTGRPRVPEGQTFTAEPSGLSPRVTP